MRGPADLFLFDDYCSAVEAPLHIGLKRNTIFKECGDVLLPPPVVLPAGTCHQPGSEVRSGGYERGSAMLLTRRRWQSCSERRNQPLE